MSKNITISSNTDVQLPKCKQIYKGSTLNTKYAVQLLLTTATLEWIRNYFNAWKVMIRKYQLMWMAWYFSLSHLSRWIYYHPYFAVRKSHQHVPSEEVNITTSIKTKLNLVVPNYLIYLHCKHQLVLNIWSCIQESWKAAESLTKPWLENNSKFHNWI